jgi:hypothetical protein
MEETVQESIQNIQDAKNLIEIQEMKYQKLEAFNHILEKVNYNLQLELNKFQKKNVNLNLGLEDLLSLTREFNNFKNSTLEHLSEFQNKQVKFVKETSQREIASLEKVNELNNIHLSLNQKLLISEEENRKLKEEIHGSNQKIENYKMKYSKREKEFIKLQKVQEKEMQEKDEKNHSLQVKLEESTEQVIACKEKLKKLEGIHGENQKLIKTEVQDLYKIYENKVYELESMLEESGKANQKKIKEYEEFQGKKSAEIHLTYKQEKENFSKKYEKKIKDLQLLYEDTTKANQKKIKELDDANNVYEKKVKELVDTVKSYNR